MEQELSHGMAAFCDVSCIRVISCEDSSVHYLWFPDGLRLISQDGKYVGWYACDGHEAPDFKQREKLVELLRPWLAHLSLAAANDLISHGVTVLPCKIGDEFWTDWVGVTKVKCSMLTQKADGSWKGRFSVDNGWGSSVNVSLDEIGKTLFKTKEEAEANLLQPSNGE